MRIDETSTSVWNIRRVVGYPVIKILFDKDEVSKKDKILESLCKINANTVINYKVIAKNPNSIYLGFEDNNDYQLFKDRVREVKMKNYIENTKIDVSQIKLVPYRNLNISNTTQNVKYFDENGILQVIPKEQAYGIVDGVIKENEHMKASVKNAKIREMFGSNNLNLIAAVTRRIQPGENFEKFLEYCKETTFKEKHTYSSELERFIGRIDKISIERDAENLNKNTFDFIRVKVYLNELDNLKGSLKENAKKYLPDIMKTVLDKIKNNNYYKRYGIPIEFLKVSNITLTKDAQLEFIFELKEILFENETYTTNKENENSIGKRK